MLDMTTTSLSENVFEGELEFTSFIKIEDDPYGLLAQGFKNEITEVDDFDSPASPSPCNRGPKPFQNIPTRVFIEDGVVEAENKLTTILVSKRESDDENDCMSSIGVQKRASSEQKNVSCNLGLNSSRKSDYHYNITTRMNGKQREAPSDLGLNPWCTSDCNSIINTSSCNKTNDIPFGKKPNIKLKKKIRENKVSNLVFKYQPHDNSGNYRCHCCLKTFKMEDKWQKHINNFVNYSGCFIGLKPTANITLWNIKTKQGMKCYQCISCNFSSKYKTSVEEHWFNLHGGQPTVPCALCPNKLFSTQRYLRKHLQLMHIPKCLYECDECNFKTKTKDGLVMHMYIHSGMAFQCKICDFKTSTPKNLRKHNIRVHTTQEKTLKCNYCNYQTSQRDHIKSHLNYCHTEKPIHYYYCANCSYKTKKRSYIIKHMKKKHGLNSFESSNHQQNISEFVRNKIYKYWWRYSFKKVKNTNLNLVNISSGGANDFRCYSCSKTFQDQLEWENHIKVFASYQGCFPKIIINIDNLFELKKGEKSNFYKCKKCNFFSYYKTCFRTHYTRRHKSLNLKCALCPDSAFCNSLSLKLHIRQAHDSRPMLACNLCNFMHKSKMRLIIHIHIEHFGMIYYCENCSYITTAPVNLENHKLKKHNLKRRD